MCHDEELRRAMLAMLDLAAPSDYASADDACDGLMSELEAAVELTPEQHSACCDQIEDWWSKGD